MYNVRISVKDNISEKEKADRVTRFKQAFVTAAASYYTSKPIKEPTMEIKKVKESA